MMLGQLRPDALVVIALIVGLVAAFGGGFFVPRRRPRP